jgi:hypothetical protein
MLPWDRRGPISCRNENRGQRAVGCATRLIGLIALLCLNSGLGSLVHSNNTVTLAWNPPADPSTVGYRVYRGIAPRTYSTRTDVGAVSSIAIAGLAAGGTYFFAVTAYDFRGLESPFSGEIHYTVPAATNVPSQLELLVTSGKQVLLSGTGPVGYTYDVLASGDLQAWTTNGALTVDAGGLIRFTAPAPATNSPCFYRLSQSFPYRDTRKWTNISDSAINLAVGKAATQSSTYHLGSHIASRAVDGNTDGAWEHGSVASTESTPNAWWQVDLGEAHAIRTITLWNRLDCCSDRLSNYYVLVSEKAFQSTNLQSTLTQAGVRNYYQNASSAGSTSISINQLGRYIRVQLAGTNFLSLAEVQVFGTVTNIITAP